MNNYSFSPDAHSPNHEKNCNSLTFVEIYAVAQDGGSFTHTVLLPDININISALLTGLQIS